MAYLRKHTVLTIGIITFLIIYGILVSIGLVDEPDSSGYIDALINRPPVYPLFIDLFQLVFGENFMTPLVFLQLLLGILATLAFIKTISRLFSVYSWVLYGLSLIIISPYFFYSRIGNMIMTEGLAYPLFVFLCHIFSGASFLKAEKSYTFRLLFFYY